MAPRRPGPGSASSLPLAAGTFGLFVFLLLVELLVLPTLGTASRWLHSLDTLKVSVPPTLKLAAVSTRDQRSIPASSPWRSAKTWKPPLPKLTRLHPALSPSRVCPSMSRLPSALHSQKSLI